MASSICLIRFVSSQFVLTSVFWFQTALKAIVLFGPLVSQWPRFQAPEAYSAYGGGRQQRPARSRRLGRRQQGGRRRSQQVTDTVSYVSSSESAKLSRFREISNFNDTVYEMNGKRMYSYYWEVKVRDDVVVTSPGYTEEVRN